MIVVHVMLLVVGYLIIGNILSAIVCSIVGDDDLEASCVIAWPIMLIFVLGYVLYISTKFIANLIVNTVKNFFKEVTNGK